MTVERQTVVGAVIISDGRVLAARRTGPPELAGMWEFPGGKVEPGEDPRAALVREIAEELSATISVGEEVADGGAAWPISKKYELRLFAATVVSGELVAGADHDSTRWFFPHQLESVTWLPTDHQALPAVRSVLQAADI